MYSELPSPSQTFSKLGQERREADGQASDRATQHPGQDHGGEQRPQQNTPGSPASSYSAKGEPRFGQLGSKLLRDGNGGEEGARVQTLREEQSEYLGALTQVRREEQSEFQGVLTQVLREDQSECQTAATEL